MNKAEVIDRVSGLSGIDHATCEKVLKALQTVLQEELGNSGKMGAIGKVMELVQMLRQE